MLTLNKPADVSICKLDLSKNLMYDFYYNYMKKNYGHTDKLLFTDLTYKIKANVVYEDFHKSKNKLLFLFMTK